MKKSVLAVAFVSLAEAGKMQEIVDHRVSTLEVAFVDEAIVLDRSTARAKARELLRKALEPHLDGLVEELCSKYEVPDGKAA